MRCGRIGVSYLNVCLRHQIHIVIICYIEYEDEYSDILEWVTSEDENIVINQQMATKSISLSIIELLHIRDALVRVT